MKYAFDPRILRSPLGDCWGREIETVLQSYPEDYLKGIAEEGYNGIWAHVNLKETVPSALFPDKKRKRIHILNRLVKKTANHGIKVYCYILEPRALPGDHPFWRKNPGLKGQPHEGRELLHSLCTSKREVKGFLQESSYNLFNLVPGLGGAFLITASEQHTHCYSHFPIKQKRFSDPNIQQWANGDFLCPRCARRSPPEVAAEVVNLVNRGVKKADKNAEVIAWTWSWYMLEPDPQKELISLLSKDVTLMSDFERGGRKKAADKIFPLDEYSFSYMGPSPRFRKHYKTAEENGLKVMAKIQTSSTHELASVPYIPVPYLLAEKYRRMKHMKAAGYLGCWIFGGNISPMTGVSGKMSVFGDVKPASAVSETARELFGEKSADSVCRAWKKFSDAWKEYPFSIPFLYYGPINYATACPLRLNIKQAPPVEGWLPLPRDKNGRLKSGDNRTAWLKPFSGEIVIEAFSRLLKGWEEGVKILREALEKDPGNSRLEGELRLGRHIELSVKSTVNIVRFYMLIDSLRSGKGEKKIYRKLQALFEDETRNTGEDRELVLADELLGYHTEAAVRLYTAEDLDYKIRVLGREIGNIEKLV